MNKETRTFIWGLILFFCGAGFLYADLKTIHHPITFMDIVGIIVDFYLMWKGADKIIKTTD